MYRGRSPDCLDNCTGALDVHGIVVEMIPFEISTSCKMHHSVWSELRNGISDLRTVGHINALPNLLV
jgi:hypothetical protein